MLTKVEINVISKKKYYLIKDNGHGFNPDNLKEGNGLINMKERAMELGFKF